MTNTKKQHWSLPPFKVKLWVKTLLFLVLHQLLAHTGLAALLWMYQVTVYAKTNTHTHFFVGYRMMFWVGSLAAVPFMATRCCLQENLDKAVLRWLKQMPEIQSK